MIEKALILTNEKYLHVAKYILWKIKVRIVKTITQGHIRILLYVLLVQHVENIPEAKTSIVLLLPDVFGHKYINH